MTQAYGTHANAWFGVLAVLAVASACSESADTVEVVPNGADPNGGISSGTEPQGTEPAGTEPNGTEPEGTEPNETDPLPPLYLVQARVFSADVTTGLLTPTYSLDTNPDYARSLEQAGGGVLYAQPRAGMFLIGSAEEPTLTRYEVGKDDRLVAGKTLSFANYGVLYMYAGESVVFLNERKAYYLDLDQLQAIAFDPMEMAITGSVSLEDTAREGFFTSFGQVVQRADGVYFPVQWYSEPDWDRVPSGSMLVRLDPETDEVTITSDTRCSGMYVAMTTEAGDSYWFSDSYNTLARRGFGEENGGPDCALRLRPGQSTFDPDWELDIGARTAGAPAVPILQGGGSNIWLRVLDDSVQLPELLDFDTLNTVPAWQWYLLDVESDAPAVRNDERPLSAIGGFGLYVDGRSFSATENADYSESTLIELTPQGFVTRATLRGIVDNVVRVR